MKRLFSPLAWILFLGAFILSACGGNSTTEPTLAETLTFYDWAEDVPQEVFDAFEQEYGVKVTYLTYETQEAAIDEMRAGQAFDVVVMESRFVPLLTREGLLAQIQLTNIPNFKNISANFRDLAYDPGNQYTIPFNWGTNGILYRTDLVEEPVTRWADLWDERYSGMVGLWDSQPRETLGLTLRSLGYSANSENPAELEAALEALLELKPRMHALEEFDSETCADPLANGDLAMAMGWAGDLALGLELNENIAYVLPEEGAMLWGDVFVISSNTASQHTAEVFLNFLLRPEIAAMIADFNYYATPNEAAYPFIAAEIFSDPAIFPPNADLANAEILLPLSVEGQALYDRIWERYLSSDQ